MEKSNNAGFSLVELIVVILIMGIIAGGATISIATVINADSGRAVRAFTSTMTQARQEAMAITDNTTTVYVRLFAEDNSHYAEICVMDSSVTPATVTVTEKRRLGNYKIAVSVENHNDTDNTSLNYDISGTSEAKFTFKKSSGGVIENYDGVNFNDDKVIIVKETGRCY